MDDLSSPNKAVRRNGLKKILEEVKGENFVKDDHLLPFFSKLLYSDEYDTSRELSFQIAIQLFDYVKEQERDSISEFCFEVVKKNVLNQKSNETEAVRICISQLLALLLTQSSNAFLFRHIDVKCPNQDIA
ncbi:hypothetical protein JH06_1258 [Blastocystis sp. subtype 4]|uniref:hypothetical protein n=1 Tax=Blastocystis sp. subtype 4 TaxID=944170 RepID=UPI0007112EAF|nr:hypothetical protein JH06_1258 [Blastocystis sp. subtype 4]KNB45220.1 hypothetical protein JH06_1258 [Blastocystis sp. subtype 4]|eukprot:XP_014528663.1 hypothetical protein JH06_1258 [Blastocystis sp. subtype 4]